MLNVLLMIHNQVCTLSMIVIVWVLVILVVRGGTSCLLFVPNIVFSGFVWNQHTSVFLFVNPDSNEIHCETTIAILLSCMWCITGCVIVTLTFHRVLWFDWLPLIAEPGALQRAASHESFFDTSAQVSPLPEPSEESISQTTLTPGRNSRHLHLV